SAARRVPARGVHHSSRHRPGTLPVEATDGERRRHPVEAHPHPEPCARDTTSPARRPRLATEAAAAMPAAVDLVDRRVVEAPGLVERGVRTLTPLVAPP